MLCKCVATFEIGEFSSVGGLIPTFRGYIPVESGRTANLPNVFSMICIFACVIERFCAQGGGYGVPEHQRDEEEESSADRINIANLC